MYKWASCCPFGSIWCMSRKLDGIFLVILSICKALPFAGFVGLCIHVHLMHSGMEWRLLGTHFVCVFLES